MISVTDTGSVLRRRRRWANQENIRRQARYRAELARWQRVDDALARLLAIARTFTGYQAGEEPGEIRLILRREERTFCRVSRAFLVRVRRPPGRRAPGYSDYSVVDDARLAAPGSHPVGSWRRRGEFRRILETGPVTITDQRVVFHGPERDRVWSYDSLVDVEHGVRHPLTLFHLRDRDELSGLAYTRAQAPMVRFMLALARAHAAGEVDSFVARLEADRAAHLARRPATPQPVGPDDAPGLPAAVLAAAAAVYFGRRGQPLRWRFAQFVAAVIATAGLVALVIPRPWAWMHGHAGRPPSVVPALSPGGSVPQDASTQWLLTLGQPPQGRSV